MKSGLGDRNNVAQMVHEIWTRLVSMKSGLGDRNNTADPALRVARWESVSMKSGLRDRNNWTRGGCGFISGAPSLNEVRA